MLNFLTESTKGFEETPTIGSFKSKETVNGFDDAFTEAANDLMGVADIMTDINKIIKNDDIMHDYKTTLLAPLYESARHYDAIMDDCKYSNLYEQVSQLFDNTRDDLISESALAGQLLPIVAIDFPILVKQHLKIATKDIIQTEVCKSPVIKKHIERTWIVDNQTGKRWEYPKCFFNDEYREIFAAGKGLPIKHDPVDITSGVFKYDIIANLTDAAVPEREAITIDLRIVEAIDTNGVRIPLKMRINLSDGAWLGGTINYKYTVTPEMAAANPALTEGEEIVVEDLITGNVDFVTNKVTIAPPANGKIVSIVFDGYLSNELNERGVRYDYTREELEWHIEDGFRANIPYSVEELQDSKALMNIDLYKKSYDNMTNLLVQMEDSNIIDFLDKEYEKYRGIELDKLSGELNPFIREQIFDCAADKATTALPAEYIQVQLKWLIDRFIIDICDTAKLEDMTFVIYGNPRYISLLGDAVNWVVKNGDMVGGVKANYSYGVMTSGGVKVQVVSVNKINAAKQPCLRLIPYPLSQEQFTFKHYKYATHILTTTNSGYKAPNRPGGSMTNLMGTIRCTTAAVQGIQAKVGFKNAQFILNY